METITLHKAEFFITLYGLHGKPSIDHVAGYHTWIVSTAGNRIHIGVDKRKGYWYITEISTGRTFGTGNGYKTRRDALASITDHQIDTVSDYLTKHPDLAIA